MKGNIFSNNYHSSNNLLLTDDTVEAFRECQTFFKYLQEKHNALENFYKDLVEKYPTHAEYFNSLMLVDDVKKADHDVNMLKDALVLIEMKKELITDNAKECKNLLSVLKDAL